MRLKSHLKAFRNDRSGQFAVILSLCLLPLLAAVGIGIDYTYALQSKTRLQDSVDAAALFAAIEYRKSAKLPDKAKVINYVNTDFAKTTGENDPVVTTYKYDSGRIYVDATIKAPNHIMQIFGKKFSMVGVSSVVNVGSKESIEIALVLDTTASMAALSGTSTADLDPEGKYFGTPSANVSRIDALKFSASQFTTSVFATDAGAGMVRISVVPFAEYVNVGVPNRKAAWMSVPDDVVASGPDYCYDYTPVTSTTNCRQELATVDGAKVPVTVCDYTYGPPEKVCYKTGGSTWYGCVGSRAEPLNLRDSSPTTKFTGIMDFWCANPLTELSGVENDILTTINNLGTSGNTYIPEGVMWGMRTLSTLSPFTTVKTTSGVNKVRKIMVLMTDGDNQAVADLPTAPTHHGIADYMPTYAADKAQTDKWTLEACKEAKKADVEVFTISFGTDISADSRALIKSCAYDKDHYFDAKDAKALSEAFKSIAAKLQGFYLSG